MKKPGVVSKWFKSETLGRKFKLFVTNKARRCILKAGGLDEYLLNTKDSTLCSKLGSELKQAIKAKNNDPEMRVPYIASTSSGHISPTKRELRRRYRSGNERIRVDTCRRCT